MIVFNNQQRSGYEEISSYSPRYYGHIREMDAVFRLAGWLTDLMARDMENMVAFQFLRFMNGGALDRYECFLGIDKDKGKTLEERKAHISAVLIGSGKMSKDMIVAMVNQYGKCDCWVELRGDELKIEIAFQDNGDDVKEIRRLIRMKGPSHLKYRFTVRFCYATADEEDLMMQEVVKNIHFIARIPFLPFRSYDGTSRYDGKTRYDARRRYKLGAALGIHCGLEGPEGRISNMSIEMRRNIQYYDGKMRYDGSTKYNAMIKKDVIE